MSPQPIMEQGNPPPIKSWPYVATIILIPALAIGGAVAVVTLRPASDAISSAANASLVTQILGFGVTITVATMAYLKSADTREVVNSRMDEFKRTMQLASDAAVLTAHAEGKAEGRVAADQRTDVLAAKTDATHATVTAVGELLKTHDQWERDRVK